MTYNKGAITLKISRLKVDWPGVWQSEAQLTSFCNAFIKHSFAYLHRIGYQDVHVIFCNGYHGEAGFDWNVDPQRDLRNEIMSDFLQPSKLRDKSLVYLAGYDSHAKG